MTGGLQPPVADSGVQAWPFGAGSMGLWVRRGDHAPRASKEKLRKGADEDGAPGR